MLVEIKARFDEQANIRWARKLEKAGCHVVYGLVGLKTHCKLALVVREEDDGLRRYCHIGTGNYNPRPPASTRTSACSPPTRRSARTSRTCSTTSPATPATPHYRRLLVAPTRCATACSTRSSARSPTTARAPARIRIKTNSLVDEEIIDALYLASQAGVPIDLWVRGICASAPGCPGCPRRSGCAASSAGSWSTPASSSSPTAESREVLDRKRRPHAAQPGPPGGGAGPHR